MKSREQAALELIEAIVDEFPWGTDQEINGGDLINYLSAELARYGFLGEEHGVDAPLRTIDQNDKATLTF